MKLYSLVCTYKNGVVHKAHRLDTYSECMMTEAYITRECYRTGAELPHMEIVEEEEVDETYTI